MPTIYKQPGLTPSERYLAKLADRTFLDLWSYPTTFRKPGKELADLLVIFGNDIIVFSDKNITFPPGENSQLNWSRWFRRAVADSVDQLRQAERWIATQPDRVFLDAKCTAKMPLKFPEKGQAQFHFVSVALGATDACRAHHNGGGGSLRITPDISGTDHIATEGSDLRPFEIGDVNPDGQFVHVFDDAGLDLVMRELDTVSDFIDYLRARAAYIRSGQLAFAPSEPDLLAFYLQTADGEFGHKFPTAHELGANKNHRVAVAEGTYERLQDHPQYLAKTQANRVSYAWDELISWHSTHVLAGTQTEIHNGDPDFSLGESALHPMAAEDRTNRRILAKAFLDIIETGKGADRLVTMRFIPGVISSPNQELGYLFLVMNHPTDCSSWEEYAEYRKVRFKLLQHYCAAAMHAYRHVKRVVGIAVDGNNTVNGERGQSQEIALIDAPEWTPVMEKKISELRKQMNLFNSNRLELKHLEVREYPELQQNRQQRRSAERRKRKDLAKASRQFNNR